MQNWTRSELKVNAKQAFYKNYWMAVAVGLVMTIFLSMEYGGTHSGWNAWDIYENRGSILYEFRWTGGWSLHPFSAILEIFKFLIVLLLGVLAVFGKILIGNVLLVGGYRFFILNRTENPAAVTLLYGFKSGHYSNLVLTMFLKNLYTFLWTLLLIVPGIIKSYEYRMIPYILAENPGMNRTDAFQISRRMMDGQKLDTFILDLSFIGWFLLEKISVGLAGIFYVRPYYQAVYAELYEANKQKAYREGYIR